MFHGHYGSPGNVLALNDERNLYLTGEVKKRRPIFAPAWTQFSFAFYDLSAVYLCVSQLRDVVTHRNMIQYLVYVCMLWVTHISSRLLT